ncbi:hypothetical protein PIB30_015220 [Stylosanthes scabra]|uniref:Major facilitator superfamily (MFS) profile domain-containing protein n=1 Tax=Stylosanthes scabra TaxID=79078 RepID=A0ABU6W6G8_9FABA|nr:hypothetical protein [Stylosanthes scabra]
MADESTPLLYQRNDSDSSFTEPSLSQSLLPENKHQHLPSLNSTVEKCIGQFTWSQFLQAVLVSFAWVFDAQQTFISVFTDAQPSQNCTITNQKASIISEWNLDQENSFITGLPTSLFFLGCLAGGILLATLADSSFGRKNMLFFSCLFMSLSSLLAAFSINIWMYSVIKFLCGFARATIGTSALVLTSELVGNRWRGQISVVGFFCFTIGFLSLPAIAYANINSSWRNLYLYTSIPSILYCFIVKFFVRESPRWLLVKGRKEEAAETLKCIASITQSNVNLAINGMMTSSSRNNSDLSLTTANTDLYSAMKILLQKKWSSRRLSMVMASGFGIGMVYYGMPLGLGNLSFNLYLSVAFNALSELPSSLITFVLIDKFNRRTALLAFAVVSGIFSVLSTMEGEVWSQIQIIMELISFFCACTAFNVYMIFTTELFPTCVRNSALAMARQALVLGGSISPLLVGEGRKNKFVCYGVFGLVICCSGVFGVFLPETRGRPLSDTMEEEEDKGSDAAILP